MYQDYPGNFDTSSRGSSGSPAHAESYSSGGGGQQVGAGPGCTWRRGWTPAFLSPPLPLLLSLPFLGLVRKYLRATIVSSESCISPPHQLRKIPTHPPHCFWALGPWSRKSHQFPQEIGIPIIKTINSSEAERSGIMFTASLNIPDPSWSSGLYLQIN